jgi:hypothetical protein
VDGIFLATAAEALAGLKKLDLAFTMASLASLDPVLSGRPAPGRLGLGQRPVKLKLGMVGTPAMFELAYSYDNREELESLLLRLQMAINSANLEETRNCLIYVSHCRPKTE